VAVALVLLVVIGPSWLVGLVILAIAERGLPLSIILAAGVRRVPLRLPFLNVRTPKGRGWLRRITFSNPSLHRAFIVFPQLAFVLAGKLCFVGPTPHHLRRSLFLEQQFPSYARRLEAKPGLISPRALAIDPSSERLGIDIETLYLDRASLSFDLWLIWRMMIDKGRQL
jgi:hypothetical protein